MLQNEYLFINFFMNGVQANIVSTEQIKLLIKHFPNHLHTPVSSKKLNY